MRKDERLKTIYETAAQMIVRSESAWKDYLAFASRIHKHDFDTSLLVYAQNDSVTALASTAQWNRIGRYVNKGATGIATCEYENAKLTISYLFDISQTNGREVKLTDWQLDENMKAELAQRFIRADHLQADTFAEVVYALAAEGTAEKYEACLRSIKANAQNHIFSELPEVGLEAQLISLLTDSAAYLIGKRCGLSDEQIQIKDGMQTISHFNTIPLLASLGNTVMAVARERLIEMELTIKTIKLERSQSHGKQTEPELHGERRNPVSEPANIQRPASRPTAGTVRENGAGILEGAASRPVYSFENGWQPNGDYAQGTGGSGGEDRNADPADASERAAANESRNRTTDRGHSGTNAPPEQPETVGRGNRSGGSRSDTEISDNRETTEPEPPKDGSGSLFRRQMSDAEIKRHYLYVLTSTNLYPSELHNAMRTLLSEQPDDHDWREKGKAVGRLFTEYGDREYQGEVLYRTQLRGKAGISMYFGDNGYTYLPWMTVANIINALIEDDEYPAFQQEEPQANSLALPEYGEVLADQQESIHAGIMESGNAYADEKADAENPDRENAKKPKIKNNLESRNYRTFGRLFPDILSKKYRFLRLESEGFEPLSLQWLSGRDLSMRHTYVQGDDWMYDPDMVLRIDTDNQTIQAASFEQSSLGLYQEVFSGDSFRPKLLKELNAFLSNWLSNIAVQGYTPVRAIEVVNDEDREIEFNAPETVAQESESTTAEEPASLSSSMEQISLFGSQPDEENDSRVRDEAVMLFGSNVVGDKQRIYDFALTQPTGSAFASFLKKEYGIGGYSYNRYGVSFVKYDADGIHYDLSGGDRITLSWAKAAGIIQRLVNEGRYLDVPAKQVQEAEPEPTADKPDKEIKILEELLDAHHGQIDMRMTAYKGEESVGYLQYSLYEDVPSIMNMETLSPYRRQGIATRLLRQLQAQYPAVEIEWGILTDEGKALYDAVTYSVENEDYSRAKEDLEDITTKLSNYESILDNGENLTDAQAADMDELESIEHQLEIELYNLRPTRVYVRLEDEVQNTSVPESEPVQEPVQEKDTDSVPPIPRHFRYTTGMDLYPRGDKSKYQANITAIKLLRQIEADQRQATSEEQTILARYCGWGGLANAFSEKSEKWAHEYQELKSVLTENEYRAAKESTLTAYYTDPEIIRHIYKAVESFGFHGGADRKILDPATGTGNFFSVLPESWWGTKLCGTEIDSITGRIARQLYPEADIQVKGFETAAYEDNSFDICIGNIPFNSIKIYDPRYKDKNFFIHDYFIAKSIDLTKPGGIIAYITTSGTMDKQDKSVRRYIAERAEFIGAVRLPNTAFRLIAGTEVTSDIIFLKKRAQPIEFSAEDSLEWINTKLEGKPKWIRYNQYFHIHPEMVLGEMQPSSNMYGREDGTACIAPEDYDLYGELERAVDRLYAVFEAEPDRPITRLTVDETDEMPEYENAPEGTKNMTFVIRDGNIYYCEQNKLIPQPFTGKKAERIKGLCDIRTALLNVIAVQSRPYEETELKEKQTVLNRVYDRFVRKHGAINSKGNILAFSDDDQFPLLRSIENEIKGKDGSVRYEKAQIFTKATIRPQVIPDHADTAEDALYISLNTQMKVDLRYMSSLTGKEPSELIEELGDKVYLNPHKYYGNMLEGWETAEEYLSGNVRDKLLYAKVKAEEAPDLFARNVTALEAVQPVPLQPADIDASIGAPWIPMEIYQQFMYETFGTSASCQAVGNPQYDKHRITLQYMEYTTSWYINGKAIEKESIKVNQTYGTKRKNAYEIYEDCLNQQSTTVRDKVEYQDENGNKRERYIVNPTETRIARAKQSQIKEAFAAWIWKEAERRDMLLKIYNDRFNIYVPREYDGSHLIFPGISEEEHLRPHQANFAARVIYSGRGLASHEVGAGKTAALIAAGMYLKSLGAIKKPVYVVPNPLVGQWATEFYRFFPNARLLVSADDEFSAKKRDRHVSRIAMGDYDAVILAHSQFERIPISSERQKITLQKQINEIACAIERMKEQKGENWTVKQMVRLQMNLRTRLEKLSAEEKKDDLLTFEELGIDFMFIDEAHMFKNCFVHTKLSRVAGVNTSSSQRAFDVLMKCQYLQEINNGRGVVFATGTPVSNSMSEMYVMMRYLEPDVLRDMGVSDFDSWAATFGRIVSSLEITPEGGGWRMRQRFAKLVNLPELMQAYRLVADIQTAEMLHLERPNIKGGKAEVISTDVTEYQQAIMDQFVTRAEAIRAGKVKPYEDNMLKLTGEARLMAIDPRLIDKSAPNDPQTKLNLCIDKVFDIWQDTAADRLTQLVFCDVSTPGADDTIESEGDSTGMPGRFTNVYDEMKLRLQERGVPEDEIAFIHDAKSDPQRQTIFEKMREGNIRILLGSTSKLGTGVNVQDRVIAIHHLDVPWKPSDITQRDGRGLRQGNINPEIMIFHYITVGTFDAYLWQIQQQKLTYISQIMTGKSIARSCEDIDETVLTAAQFKAIATDNPALLEKIELENRVSELKLLQRNHENEQAELERKITRIYPSEIARHEKNIAEITADMEALKATEGREFSIVLEDKRYDERVKAGKRLLLAARMLEDSKEEQRQIGEYRKFSLSICKRWMNQELHLTGSHQYSCEMGITEIGTISRLENLIERIPEYLKYEQLDMEEVKVQLESAKKEYGVPFAYEAELSQKSARLSEVETELELGKGDDQDVIMDEGVQDKGTCSSDKVKLCMGSEV